MLCIKGDRVIAKLTRSGRLYGKPSQMTVEYIAEEDGQIEREVPDACFEDTELGELLVEEEAE